MCVLKAYLKQDLVQQTPGCQNSMRVWNKTTDWFSQPCLRLSTLEQILHEYRKKCNKKPWISWPQPFHLNHFLTVNTASGPFKGMSLFIFGLWSVVFNLCLTNSVQVLYENRRYITEERDRLQRVGALTAAQIQWGQLIFNMSVDNLWLPMSHQFSLSGWQNFKIMIPTTFHYELLQTSFSGENLQPNSNHLIFLSLRPICHKIWLFWQEPSSWPAKNP